MPRVGKGLGRELLVLGRALGTLSQVEAGARHPFIPASRPRPQHPRHVTAETVPRSFTTLRGSLVHKRNGLTPASGTVETLVRDHVAPPPPEKWYADVLSPYLHMSPCLEAGSLPV